MSLHSGVTDDQFIALWRETGGRAKQVAAAMGNGVDDECSGDLTLPLGMIVREEVLQAGPVRK